MDKNCEKPAEDSIAGPGVLDKYNAAGKVAKQVMEELITKCIPLADIYELTVWGNKRIIELCKEHFSSSKKMEKGVAFPVCISPNEFVGNLAPLKGESFTLKTGDLVKIELGVHMDGYPVSLAHTTFLGEPSEEDKKLLTGGYLAVLGAFKALAVNRESGVLTQMQQCIGESLNVSFLEGSASREVKRYLIEGGKTVPSKIIFGSKTENFKIKANEVFAVEAIVVLGQSEGKLKTSELRSTVFRRNIEVNSDPKTTSGRQFLKEVREKFSDMTFSINQWEDELSARVGSSDCLNNNLISPLHVYHEKSKARVAHFKWTIGVSGKRLFVLSGLVDQPSFLKTLPVLQNEEMNKIFQVTVESLTAKPLPKPKTVESGEK